MEGVGSRQSRAASRYASSPSAPVFNGPVRKWKKQWVSSQPNNQNNGSNRNHAPPLLLCRWTPLSATASADQPRKRRFRYAPIVPIEKGNVESLEKADNEAGISIKDQPNSGADMRIGTDGMLEKPTSGGEAQALNEDQADSNTILVRGSHSEERRELIPNFQ